MFESIFRKRMTEPIRGCERDRRKEVRREAQCKGPSAAGGADPRRKNSSRTFEQGPKPVEGRRRDAGEGWSDSQIAAALDIGQARRGPLPPSVPSVSNFI